MKLEILDHLSDPGMPGKTNEDSLCMAECMAAVFDGATGLGDATIFPEAGTDAAWIAEFAARRFAASAHDPAVDIVRRVAREARAQMALRADPARTPRYAWPSAGFEMARLSGGALELVGLGDCSAYVLAPGGDLSIHSAMPAGREAEMAAARALLDKAGGYQGQEGIVRHGETLEALRRGRERQNTPEGAVWTLGLVEEAAEHVSATALTAQPGMLVLLATDGFTALCEMYRRHSPAGLVEIAARDGLRVLLDELRLVERALDPQAIRFPRFKRCDDATAMVLRVV